MNEQGKNVLISSSENAIRGLLMHLCDIPIDQIHQVCGDTITTFIVSDKHLPSISINIHPPTHISILNTPTPRVIDHFLYPGGDSHWSTLPNIYPATHILSTHYLTHNPPYHPFTNQSITPGGDSHWPALSNIYPATHILSTHNLTHPI